MEYVDALRVNSSTMEHALTTQLVNLDTHGLIMLVPQFLVIQDLNLHQAARAVKPQFSNAHQELIGTDIDVCQLLKHAQ
jgi:hypothetical protein